MNGKVLLLLPTALLLAACSADPAVQSATPSQQAQQAQPSQSAAPVMESAPVDENAYILDACSSYASGEYIKISGMDGKTTIDLYDPETAVQLVKAKSASAMPDGWDSLRDGIVALSADLDPLSGTSTVLIYLKDAEEGDIYLTASGGSVIYDAFTGQAPAVYNAPTISLAEFNQISTGMSYDEVVAIIGSSGTLLSESDLGLGPEYVTAMWTWEGEGSLGANANVMFQGNEVSSKAQYGLE